MNKARLDLHEIHNPNCTKCNTDERKENSEDFLCLEHRSIVDDLPVRCVGGWGREKIFFLTQYFHLFAVGMKNRWNGNIGYFEIASGPGRCIDRKTGMEFDGSSMAVLRSKAALGLKVARFIDKNERVVQALNQRISKLEGIGDVRAEIGDYEDGARLAALIEGLNPRGLNLVFIDPTDCSVPFATIEAMRKRGLKFDLIINVATKSDFNRNMGNVIDLPDSSGRQKYTAFLGSDKIFANEDFVSAVRHDLLDNARRLFVEAYQDKLRSIGFKEFAREEIHSLYELMFASEHGKGLQFWKNASAIDMDGQRGLGL